MASIRQASAMAGVSHNTVTRWIKQGKLDAQERKVGHVLAKLVEVAEVERLASQIRAGRPPKNGRQ